MIHTLLTFIRTIYGYPKERILQMSRNKLGLK